jgi:hypothetical protein
MSEYQSTRGTQYVKAGNFRAGQNKKLINGKLLQVLETDGSS